MLCESAAGFLLPVAAYHIRRQADFYILLL